MLQHTSSEVTFTYTTIKLNKKTNIGKTKRRLHDRKTEHFKALTNNSHSSAIADHMTQTGHRIKCDHFDSLATTQSDILAL